jgi:hypothetical protein
VAAPFGACGDAPFIFDHVTARIEWKGDRWDCWRDWMVQVDPGSEVTSS